MKVASRGLLFLRWVWCLIVRAVAFCAFCAVTIWLFVVVFPIWVTLGVYGAMLLACGCALAAFMVRALRDSWHNFVSRGGC